MSTLLLLDGHSLAYRAFYALPTDLATSSGHGHERGLRLHVDAREGARRREARPPRGRVRRRRAKTFRKEMDATYKAGRKETPDLFRSQLPLIHQVLEALAVPMLEVAGRGGRRRDRHARGPRRGAGHGHDRRHRRPRLVPARARPAPQGPLQQARRLGLRAVRRGRHPRAHRGHARGSTWTTPRSAATRATTCPACPGIGEKTAAKLDERPTARSKASSSTSTTCRRSSGRTSASSATRCSTTARCRCCGPTCDLDLDPDDLRMGGWDQRGGAAALPAARVPHALPAAARGARRGGRGRRRRATTLDVDGATLRHAGRDRRSTSQAIAERGRAVRARGRLAGSDAGARRAPGARDRGSTDDAVYVHADDLRATPRSPAALGELLGPDGPPLVAHRGQGADARARRRARRRRARRSISTPR